MTNWHESPLMIVKSADPTKLGGSAMGISIKDATRALLTASPISGDNVHSIVNLCYYRYHCFLS
ncbi:MAG: hypothetical protein WBP64_11435 [Nitrososphaeraceae archaeon]